jgi:hypothetical protein
MYGGSLPAHPARLTFTLANPFVKDFAAQL